MQNPNDSYQKYFLLMWMLIGSVLGFGLLIVILFYVLKLFSIAMFHIPGSGYFFRIFIVAVPYLILFSAYYLVHRTISYSRKSAAAMIARTVLSVGSLVCIGGLVLSLLLFFQFKTAWLIEYDHYSNYSFAAHLILILISAGILATGEPKEKSWLERTR